MTLETGITKSPKCSSEPNSNSKTSATYTSGRKACSGKSGKKKAQRKLPILIAIKPLNLAEEKKKFFESQFRYNPQFRYAENTEKAQKSYGDPSDKYIPQVWVVALTESIWSFFSAY